MENCATGGTSDYFYPSPPPLFSPVWPGTFELHLHLAPKISRLGRLLDAVVSVESSSVDIMTKKNQCERMCFQKEKRYIIISPFPEKIHLVHY